jgi:ABC-type uncharacterized transport system permease subunit
MQALEPVLSLLAIAVYLLTGALLWRRMLADVPTQRGPRILLPGTLGVLLHGGLLYGHLLAQGLNLGFTNAVSLIAWVVAVLFLLASLKRPVHMLGIVIMPIAAFTVLMEWLWPSQPISLPPASVALFAHIIVSLLAYGLLSIAVVQSLLLSVQERRLHGKHKQTNRFLGALPPLETMETLMFQMIGVGFFLLTLTLISGLFFSEVVFGKPLKFTHHIVLSLFAWIAFAVLLLGRWRFGWRGRSAIRWTLGAFSLLVLGYFGTKFVLEILLSRAG